jgi:hypothetical protein
MRPLAVLLGIVMGSTVSIALCLAMTLVVFLLIPEFATRVGEEFPPLLRTLAGSAALAALASLSFYGELRDAGWRRAAHTALSVALIATVVVAWPRD